MPPQLPSETVEQRSPSQQPDVHDVASQLQRPAAHRWPGEHARSPPHSQAPEEEHESASIGSQVTQVEPPTPHVAAARTRQVGPSQQPDGQEAESQMQRPTTQR